ncbi:MAG: tRNA pseudouridine(55) synthase TruB [Rhodoferax sp.]
MNTAPRARVARRPVHGVLLLDKPLGWSSNDVLQKAKWLLRAEKAGHTGTLDPLATGVLPLCFGAATKFSQVQLDADKTYQATLVLGRTTSTGDAEGQTVCERPVRVCAEQVQQVAQRFLGSVAQTPPMYSALKHQGRPLYAYARAGQTVERAARTVTIYALNLTLTQSEYAQATIEMIVTCSKGTYVRTLAEDIGEALGCGAHLSRLRRLDTGGLNIADALTLDAWTELTDTQRVARLLPVAVLLRGHTAVTLDDANAARFLSGLRRRGHWADTPTAAVYALDGTLLGSARIQGGELIPVRLLSAIEIQQIKSQNMGLAVEHASTPTTP